MDSIYEIISRSKYPEEIEGYLSNPIIGKKAVWDPLGNKLSANEKISGDVPPEKFFSIRLDGKNFSTVIPILKKLEIFEEGYSETFEKIMKNVSLRLFKFLPDSLYVFTQSDEITIILDKCKLDTQGNYLSRQFDGRKDKYLSLTASFVSTTFYQLLIQHMILIDKIDLLDDLPQIIFDARLGTYDSIEDAFEIILWRSYDCSVNGITSEIYFRSFPDKKLVMKYNCTDKLKFLLEKGLLPLPDHQVYGSLYKSSYQIKSSVDRMTGKTHIKRIRVPELIPGAVIANMKDGVIVL